MAEALLVLVGWIAFGGAHIFLSSERIRSRLTGQLGPRGFQVVYSLVALGTFVFLVRTYAVHRHSGPVLWEIGDRFGVKALAIVLSAVAVVFLVLALLQPSPVSWVAGGAPRARGVIRITRHPMFTAIGLWGFAHALTNGHLADVLFFSGFPVFGIVGAIHQDMRKRAAGGPMEALYRETSLLPFGAILSGRNSLVLAEIPGRGMVIGLVAAAILYALHWALFWR